MTGYRGRIGIYELLEIDGPIADAIRRANLVELERLAARAPGFVPLAERALSYALDGKTSVAEIMTSMAGLEEPARGESLIDDVLTSEAKGAAAESPARVTG
jgi:MSHA biogenesis protein MshE